MKEMGTEKSGAIFSDDMIYRYRLWRIWDFLLPRALFILLNPSTADEIDNDATIERQQRRVVSWGRRGLIPEAGRTYRNFGAIEVVNACALRSTNPEALFKIADPFGPDNGVHMDNAIEAVIQSNGIIVCGWGAHLTKLSVGNNSIHSLLVDVLKNIDGPLTAFALNQDGTPKHPLYCGYDLLPRRWAVGQLHEAMV